MKSEQGLKSEFRMPVQTNGKSVEKFWKLNNEKKNDNRMCILNKPEEYKLVFVLYSSGETCYGIKKNNREKK